ncbi:MAG: hypothetical protein ABI790_01295 [Betaproteobacteria bacterium]
MENSVLKISRALLDLATFSDAVLHVTPKARAAQKSAKLDSTQLRLLERIDGFRSLEQLLAMSGDLIAVHAALGKLMSAGLVATDSLAEASVAAPSHTVEPPVETKEPSRALAATPAPARTLAPVPAPSPARVRASAPLPAPATMPEKAPVTELDEAKRLLLVEAKLALGKGAEKLRGRIESCDSIAEIFDLIVKVQEFLATSGKANPDVFIDRLTAGLVAARKKSSTGKRAPA